VRLFMMEDVYFEMNTPQPATWNLLPVIIGIYDPFKGPIPR
jgi:hypothetical protein